MANKSRKIRTIFFIYWFLLCYIISALVWWFIALSQQNNQMTLSKIHLLKQEDAKFELQYTRIIDEQKRKTAQYIGEGAIFLLLISAGAIFLFKAVNKQLKISEQQQNFMMAITHELKTPIAVSKLNLETLQKRKLDQTQQERLINNTLEEANRLNALCNNLLLSYQMEANGYKVVAEKINLSEIIESCIRDFKSRFPQKNIIAEINENMYILGDEFLLQMVFNNLIDNAYKYSPKDTAIRLTADKKNKECWATVIDEGNGISHDEKQKVFKKFYRLGKEATQKAKGTGLGLFLVKRIIDTHQGRIKIEDNFPRGSKFIIEFKTIV